MASDRGSDVPAKPGTVVVAVDSLGCYLVMVAREGPPDLWPTIRIDEEGVKGPISLGRWLRFCPSDYAEVPAPYPDDVVAAAERLKVP